MYVGEGLDKIQEGDAMESVDIGRRPPGKLGLCFVSASSQSPKVRLAYREEEE